MKTPIWVWQTMAAMLVVSLAVYAATGAPLLAALSQVPVAWIVGELTVNRYVRRQQERRI